MTMTIWNLECALGSWHLAERGLDWTEVRALQSNADPTRTATNLACASVIDYAMPYGACARPRASFLLLQGSRRCLPMPLCAFMQL